MFSHFKLVAVAIITLISLSFAQDVTLTIDGTSLNYESTADIYGWQFDHDGCASGASGGDSGAAGFMISCSATTCLGFSLTGSFVSLGTGTLVDLGGECSTLDAFVFAGNGGVSLEVELSGGGGLPTVAILAPADGDSFDDVTSVDVEVSCSDCGDGDHYHADLDGTSQGMFYEDNFSINNIGYGDHTLTVILADGAHVEYSHDGSSASVSFSVLETSAGGCDDPSACNDGDPDNECTYAEENYDCDGNCTAGEDCAGTCGGDLEYDTCGICDGDNSLCDDCAGVPGGTAYEDNCGVCDDDASNDCVQDCAGEWGGSAEVDECGECGGDGSSCASGSGIFGLSLNDEGNLDVTYETSSPIFGFQFNISDVSLTGASGGAAEDAGFMVSSSATTVVGFSLTGASIAAGSGVLTVLSFEGSGEACLSDIVVAETQGGDAMDTESGDCVTIEETCDSGIYDCSGVCDGTAVEDCAGECGGSAEADECGVCGGDNSSCADCAGVPNGDTEVDACGVCGGDEIDPDNCDDCSEGYDVCGICGGIATNEDGCFIELSIGSVSDGVMEIILNNTIPISGFQFELTGVELGAAACSGGLAGDLGFQVSNNESGMVLGFSMIGDDIPQGNGVLTNVAYTATSDLSCITNEVIALGDWAGGFYEINIGACEALDFGGGSNTVDVLYNSDTDIAGFQFYVDGDVTVIGVSGGEAEVADFQLSTGNNTVLGFSMIGTTIPSGSGTLVTLEFEGDGSPCLSAIIVSDPAANGLDTEVSDCLTINAAAPPCDDLDSDGLCDDEDPDVDGDSVNTDADSDDNDPFVCSDDDSDTCDDCSTGTYDPANDGSDLDGDGECDAGDDDDDGDGCLDGFEYDECGVCGGNGIPPQHCDCDQNVEDECGVCGGDGSSCVPGVFGLSLNDEGNLDVTYETSSPIFGFQFNISDVSLTGASGGAAEDAGFMVSSSATTVVGFSLTGASIAAGSGVLTVLSFEGSGEACLSDIVVAETQNGDSMDTESGDCVTIEETCDSGIYDCSGVCDGTAVEDCAGECGGSAEVDECGECGGDGIDEGACDCDGNVEDCAGVCGGSAEVDESIIVLFQE